MMNPMRLIPLAGPRPLPLLASALVGIFALGIATAGWAALRAQFERGTVPEGSTVMLSIESDATTSGERPDVAPLSKDFVVLGTTTSSTTSFVNGRRTDRTRWLVRLQPRHAGTIEVAPIAVGSALTDALRLDVTPPSPAAANAVSNHVFMEAEVAAAGKPLYVQQQVPYTVRLYFDDAIRTGELSAPDPQNAIVEQLGEEKRYTATRGGREYNVIERHYAIAPEKSGTLRIPPAIFEGRAVIARSGPQDADAPDDPMARFLRGTPFANDPFFKGALDPIMSFGDTGQPVTARSQEITVDVQPRPAAARGDWLPAEQVSLHDSWADNPPQLRVGEPVTRTITIEAKGVAASQIPPLTFAAPGNARLYAEAPDNQSRTDGGAIYGVSKQSVTYIPNAAGRLDIAPVELAWWNTRDNVQARATLPAWEFEVEPGAAGSQATAVPDVAGGKVAATTSANADDRRQRASSTEGLRSPWALLGGGVALLAVAILSGIAAARIRRRPGPPAPTTKDAPGPTRNSSLRALHRACDANDPRAAATALLELARVEWPDDPPCSLGALAARLETGNEEVMTLDRSLYGTGSHGWEGAALSKALRRGLRPRRSTTSRDQGGLEPLYPNPGASAAD
jgi:hypothetical protein